MTPTVRPGRWLALGRGAYRLSTQAATWHLTATPDAKYPWLLTGTGQRLGAVRQEIGPADVHRAQRAADLWIDLTCNFIGPAIAERGDDYEATG